MRPPPRLCCAPASCCASSQSICSMAPIPAVRQKRSKELSTSCQAVSRLGTSASDEGVVTVVMASRLPQNDHEGWEGGEDAIQRALAYAPPCLRFQTGQ